MGYHHDLEHAKNMKLLLTVFEQLSGLKINFHKNEIFCFGQDKQFQKESTPNCLAVTKSHSPSVLRNPNAHHHKLCNAEWGGVRLRKDLNGNYVLGRPNIYHMVADWCC